MVDTIKFSQMTAGGDLSPEEKTPGLLAGSNVLFNNPWTFLAPGTTGDRPAIASSIYYRLRLNTTLRAYEYYDPIAALWITLSTSNLFTWNTVITSPFQMVSQNGYITNSSGLVSLILPVTSLVGEEIAITGQGSGGWSILQGNLQSIHIGNFITTVGSSGSIVSNNQYDSLRLVCITANLEWTTVGGGQGNLNII